MRYKIWRQRQLFWRCSYIWTFRTHISVLIAGNDR